MKLKSFQEWLREKEPKNEVSTSTSCVATFARPVMPMVRRGSLWPWGEEDPFFKKKKKKRINESFIQPSDVPDEVAMAIRTIANGDRSDPEENKRKYRKAWKVLTKYERSQVLRYIQKVLEASSIIGKALDDELKWWANNLG